MADVMPDKMPDGRMRCFLLDYLWFDPYPSERDG